MDKLPNELQEMIEQEDFNISYDGEQICFQKYSDAGQDFSFDVEMGDSVNELAHNLLDYYNDFDVSYEASLWIDDTGHGKNGAPYDLRDIIADMEQCEGFIYTVFNIVCEYERGKANVWN